MRKDWVYGTLLIAISMIFFGIMFLTWAKMFRFWAQTSSYQHAFLVIPVVVYLLWTRRESLLAPAQPSAVMVAILIALSFCWVCAQLVNIEFIEFSAALMFLPAMIWAYTGHRTARIIWFPLVYVAFALPWWDVLAVPLQYSTAYISAQILKFVGVPIVTEGDFINIPGGQFEIEEACGGLHFFLAAFALGTLVAGMQRYSKNDRIKVVLSAIAIGIFSNWIRVIIIIFVGYMTDMRHSLVQDHSVFGWMVFFALFLPWAWWATGLRKADAGPPVSRAVSQDKGYAPLLMGIVGIAALAAWRSVLFVVDHEEAFTKRVLDQPSSWSSAGELAQSFWAPIMPATPTSAVRKYSVGQEEIWVYTASYTHQDGGAELVSSTNNFAGEGWRVTERQHRQIRADFPVATSRAINESGEQRWLVYWYDVDGRYVDRDWQEKGWELMAWLRGRRPVASIYAVTKPLAGEASDQELESLLEWVSRGFSTRSNPR